jgi:hypothetical protein
MATPPLPPPVSGPQKLTPAPGPGTPPPPMPPPMVRPTTAGMQQQATVDEAGAEEDEGLQRSFWQIPFVQDMLPFITSLVLHIGLVALGILTYKTAQVIMQASKEPMVIPSEVIIDGAEVGGIEHPGLGGDPTRDAAQDLDKNVPPDSTGIAEKPTDSLQNALKGGGAGDDNDNDIAAGLQSGPFGKGTGTGNGTGSGMGTGTGGGPAAPFGIPGGGGGLGPKSPFMGVSGNAMKVVYLCDSSGSMMSKFDSLRQQLSKATAGLKPIQSFDIIFFSEDSYVALDSKALVLASPETKRKAYEFLDKTAPHGSSDPLPGLRAAFATQPQLIYMLTDGDFPNNAQVLEELRKLNKDKKVKINTIAFMDRGEEYEKLLQQIAKEHGGAFKFVTDTDLQDK